jgi:hypothetical protein
MNIVLWSDDAGLRDTVIVDPITFFVNPAATIICKLVQTEGDPTLHTSQQHKTCRRTQPAEFADLVNNGLLHDSLVEPLLLENCGGDAKAMETVVRMMVRYSLLVPMIASAQAGTAASPQVIPGVCKYIAPLLLPAVGRDQQFLLRECSRQHSHSSPPPHTSA